MPTQLNWQQTALILVDIQLDFLPGGSLAVADGDAILAPVGRLMTLGRFAVQVATQDWHPPGHVSFASSHSGKRPFDEVTLYDHPQTLWPDHCVQGSAGAQFHPDLPWERVEAIIRKGTDPAVDSYSGFRNNWNTTGERPLTGLAGYLENRHITDVFLCGLARDVCVQWTAQDAADAGFRTWYIWDATRAVNPDNDDAVRSEMIKRDVEIVTVDQILAVA